MVSTYLVPAAELDRVFTTLIAHLIASRVDAIVLEVADGVLQVETAALLVSQAFRDVVGGVLFAGSDAMGAMAGDLWLKSRGLPLIALTGVLTAAPLQRKEAAQATSLPVFSRND